jgi:hypothetical protein
MLDGVDHLPAKDTSIQTVGDALAAQQGNAPDRPQAERHYREHVRLPADGEGARVVLRGVINERSSHGWKLISATKELSGDALLLECNTLGSFSK